MCLLRHDLRGDFRTGWRLFLRNAPATALVAGMALIHNNVSDFESIRSVIEISPERFRFFDLTLLGAPAISPFRPLSGAIAEIC
jgi:hypothetical protein